MVKYTTSMITFAEIPDEICLSFNISNCQNNCVGCHSAELRKNIGDELTEELLSKEIDKNDGITCVLFLGEGNDQESLLKLAKKTKEKGLNVALYSGREYKEIERILYDNFDYIKVGPYIPECGPLNKRTTNQRLFKIEQDNKNLVDITYKFWRENL